jgi:hypothetical protein
MGVRPEPEDDFFITQWTDKGWVRGQGIFNDKAPHFDKDYAENSKHVNVPLITHEVGQYSVYPDLREIPKYTGVLMPLNFMAVKNDLQKKGLLGQANAFTNASGKLATLLYKEEIERALKTPNIDGFQLLQLQDFPGQGISTDLEKRPVARQLRNSLLSYMEGSKFMPTSSISLETLKGFVESK